MISNKLMLFFQLQVTLYAISEERYTTESAVAPPPWADPKVNPCAAQPRGWQLLYWPPDGKCYKIFKMGYPCPDDMELSPPVPSTNVREFSAECRCPPKTAQSTFDGHCYELFKVGPCQRGQYFAPDNGNHTESASKKRHWGICEDIPTCKNSNEVFWAPNGRCYQKLTRGPCKMGQLITSSSDGLAMCACSPKNEMIDYFYSGYGCFQHFTKGPCKEKGHLFLPDRSCDCNDELPHYHDLTEQCFEIGELVKDAWERLRRCYTNALHRRRIKRSSKRIFPWKFEKEMSFLLPFLEIRKSRYDTTYFEYDENQDTTLEDLHIKEDLDNGDIDVQESLVDNLKTHFMEQVNQDKHESIERVELPSDIVQRHFMDQVDMDRRYENIERREMPGDIMRTHFMEQADTDKRYENAEKNDTLNITVEPSQRQSENYSTGKSMYKHIYSIPSITEGLDESDMFYLSMSRMMKRLPKLEQAKIKLLLSKSVLEAEVRQEIENSQVNA